MRVPLTVFGSLVLCLGVTVLPASAFDLTGHWTGKYSCKGFAAPFNRDGKQVNKFTTSHKESTLDITQNGGAFGAVIDLNDGPYRYNGFSMPSVKNAATGEVFLIGCSTSKIPTSDDTGAEIVRASVKTKDGVVKATFKGVSLFADNFPEIETCKYSYTRVDTADPGISTCP
jgi:hypothetical protein